MDEIEVVAVALDGAMRGGEGELYFRPKDGSSRAELRRRSQLPLEPFAAEARRASPDTDVRRRRPLRLYPDQAPITAVGRESLALQQELARKHCVVQLAQREHALGHADHGDSPH
jgi:hypothetical protein